MSLYDRLRAGLGYVAALGLGFTIVTASWSYRLEQMFGNPLFPLMNDVFRSPEFTTEPLRHFRFIPRVIAEALWRPFAIVDPVTHGARRIGCTGSTLRGAVVLISVLFLRWLWRRQEAHFQPHRRSQHLPRRPAYLRRSVAVWRLTGCFG